MSERVNFDTAFYERPAPGVAQLTLNRPDDANGVVPELAADLMTAIDQLEADRSVRVLVLTGAGQQFSGGADLRAMQRYLEEDLRRQEEAMNLRAILKVTQRLLPADFRSSQPSTAAPRPAGSTSRWPLTSGSRHRERSSARPTSELGWSRETAAATFLPRLVGSGIAAELALTGDVIDAKRALEIGLINHVVAP